MFTPLTVSPVCVQTAFISYDYLTAFKHVEYGTEEYAALRSKVHVLNVCFMCLFTSLGQNEAVCGC